MSAGATPAIEIRGLTKHFGAKRALDGLDLTVPAGSVFGFLGPNGAGKSTTLNILTGLARPTGGHIRMLGQDLTGAGNALRAEIGYLPDVPSFYPWMTGPEFLRFAGQLFGLGGQPLARRIEALLDLAGLLGVETPIGGYSRGMRQRLGLAQAMINAPRLLLLDEPTSALDPMGRKTTLDMILALAGRTTIFFSTHLLADVERVCDRIAIIDRGRVVAQDETAVLRSRSGARTVTATFATPAEAGRLAERLAGASWLRRVEREGTSLAIVADDLAAAQRELPARIAALGLPLLRLETGEASLEEVFIQLVGERPA